MSKKAKICFNTMVANEAHIIERMLNSVYPYIDYWVIQDNGSKDGTQRIIQNFFDEKQIPGFLYETPWEYPGYNRDHALQKALSTEHGCDWILRVDADETLEVDSDYDWSQINDTSIQSFNIVARQFSSTYQRCWLWNAKLPWKFKHDKRHEIIYLEGVGEGFQRVALDSKFRHKVYGDGNSWFNPTKFFADALEIEKDLLPDDKMKKDFYHLFYVAKSYRDAFMDPRSVFPYGDKQAMECARRAIFYFDILMDTFHDFSNTGKPKFIDESGYMNLIFLSECHYKLKNYDKAIDCLNIAGEFCPQRNEHMMRKAEFLMELGRKEEFLETTSTMISEAKPNPLPDFSYFVDARAYTNSDGYVHKLHNMACMMNNSYQVS